MKQRARRCSKAGSKSDPAFAKAEISPAGKTILLVEDEDFVLQAACVILQVAGYRVLRARTVAEAAASFQRHKKEVCLLLTDVVLPDGSGRELAEKLTAIHPALRAVFISGYPENPVTRSGLKAGKWFYLPKPFTRQSLLQKLRRVRASA